MWGEGGAPGEGKNSTEQVVAAEDWQVAEAAASAVAPNNEDAIQEQCLERVLMRLQHRRVPLSQSASESISSAIHPERQ